MTATLWLHAQINALSADRVRRDVFYEKSNFIGSNCKGAKTLARESL